ncbi:MAG: TIR domain-containing protein [Candidatus Nealsonbacteria bacterium]|nr:TIR domain-containing protein [Candidatus Nealsonbacteria bacterium]
MAKRAEKRTRDKGWEEAKRRIQHARRSVATELDLSGLSLTSVPESLGQLSGLMELGLSGNQLTSLPESLDQLSCLEELWLFDNQLTSLPESLGQLSRLETLYLSDNQLTSLPESLRKLAALKELYLHGNEAIGLPPEVLGPIWQDVDLRGHAPANPTDILAYYFRTRKQPRPLNEAKLILLGHGDVGKTSLVNRLIYDRFDKDEPKTEGIQITEWPVQLSDDEEVRLNVWDFGGQDIMHSTHQFFLTHRSLYLVVLNGRAGHEDADAEYWLSLVESFGGDSPVVVVLNKIKQQPFDLNRRALRQKFPAVREFIETDCDDRTGIDRLGEIVRRQTDGLDHLRDAFPAAWFAIKDQLAGMAENYVTFERYREICTEGDETEPAGQESLAVHLHNLGIALNYKDDPRLRDTHVLNPRWVTAGIYTILNADRLAEQKGELTVDDLAGILDADDYPPQRHAFIVELMRKFELCFAFAEDAGRYLVAELLDKQQPAAAEEFLPAECLNFQYRYPILPEGLLPRFIVRTHALSTGMPRWRTGVVLEFEGNRALVKADVQDRRVFVHVSGPAAGRRRLLAVIRSDFEHIHRSFEFRPREMVPVPGHPDVLVPYNELLVMERQGVKTLPKVVGDEVLDLDVQELLGGVDLEGTRRPAPGREPMDERRGALRVFFSYSHKDERLRDELETHLKILERRGLIATWHDRQIAAGEEWKGEIDENLERAEIVLLLVSAAFVASDYCYDVEMTRALERHESGEARVVPVILRDCLWQKAPFGKLQALPTDGKAVAKWRDKDTVWRNVAEGIELVVEQLRGSGRSGRL